MEVEARVEKREIERSVGSVATGAGSGAGVGVVEGAEPDGGWGGEAAGGEKDGGR